MPYSIEDVDKHKKGLTDKEKEQWVSVANSVLASCMEDGGDEGECAAKAIQQASGVLKRGQEEASMPNENELDLTNLRELLAQALALVDGKIAEQAEADDAESELAETELAESASGHVLSLAEAHVAEAGTTGSIVPLHLDVALITPGWGNSHDNHYYPRTVIERDSGVFAGVKMYETDHRQDEKSTRTWVSTVKEIAGYTSDGAPIGRVSVHDRNFAERLMALAADDLLEKMECSILAAGTAKKGEVDGKKGHIVEAITSANSVDWVTRAGAGGRALSLAESNTGGEPMEEQEQAIEEQEQTPTEEPLEEVTLQEQQEPEEETPAPAMLDQEKVKELMQATNLPSAAKAKLSEAEYADEDEAQAAIAAEVAYVKQLTGSGKPFAQGGGTAPESKPLSEAEKTVRFNEHMRTIGAREV